MMYAPGFGYSVCRSVKLVLATGLFICSALFARAQHKNLNQELKIILQGFHGTAGVYVENLKTGENGGLLADSLFPTASIVKTMIQCGLMEKLEKGELNYHQKLVYRDSLLYPGIDILGSFKNGDTIELSKVCMLMLTMSDNTASLWLQKLVGTPNINAWLVKNGFRNSGDNSNDPARAALHKEFGWGNTTPHEICSLFKLIWQGRAVNSSASERMYRNLSRSYWDEEALSEIPPGIAVASKQGAVDASRSEVVLVAAPHGSYVFSVFTKNAADHSWKNDNESWKLIRAVSAFLWHRYEPGSTWTPARGINRYNE